MKKNKVKPEVDKTLAVATASYRAEYADRYERAYLARHESIHEELKAAGMDANKAADYPKSTGITRFEYMLAVEKYHYVEKYFERVDYSGRPSEPRIVKERPFARAKIKEKAKEDADAAFDGYLFKLAIKIAKPIIAATYSGHLWDGSVLSVVCEDGEEQTWGTKCIWNQSCLGRIFNQWPTRRTDGRAK